MKYLVVLIFSFFIIVNGDTVPLESDATVLDYKYDNDGLGNYFFRFVTSNGITRQEAGRLVNVGQPDEHISVGGYYSYNDSDGVLQTINYIGDNNGYVILPSERTISGVPGPLIASLLGK